jgi:hypothetical protein
MLHEVYKAKRGPKALIDHFYEKVSLTESLIVVLVSFVINILFLVLFKTPDLASVSAKTVYSSILINWLALGVVLFLVMYFIRGAKKLPKNAFQKVLSALAAFRIPSIIFSIISAVIILIFLGSFIPVIQAISQNPDLIMSTTLFPRITWFNIIGIILLLTTALFFFVYWIIMFYEFSEIVFDVKNPLAKIALIILVFVLAGLLSSILL